MKLKRENLFEIKKEDEYYFQGPFWIKAESYDDMMKGNFQIIGEKILTDYNGEYKDKLHSKRYYIHSNLWKNEPYKSEYKNIPYNYYPRGRVVIRNGNAYININSLCNNPLIIDRIIKEYKINKLNHTITYNDSEGSHYDFLLK